MVITNEGLRIQIMDDDRRPMFKPGTDTLEVYMEQILLDISGVINKLSNYISIIGNTGSIKDPRSTNVNLWDLSIKRANKVRVFLEDRAGITKVAKVVGQADKDPLDPLNPYGVHNIRIGIILMHNGLLNKSQKAAPESIFQFGRKK